ncbi:hypothetical protein RQP46_001809 [Phenoliferia psychrophenolica]
MSAVTALTHTLDSLYRISIEDGRVFTGQFVCIDPQGNIVLDHATELAPGQSDLRDVGMVLVPKRFWVTVERDVGGDDHQGLNGQGLGACLAA